MRRILEIREQNGDLKTTNSGLYDERANRGKEANKAIAEIKSQVTHNGTAMRTLLATYKNARFIHAAIIAYLGAAGGCLFLQVDVLKIPVYATVISLIAAFVVRAMVVRSKPPELPQIRLHTTAVVFGAWLISAMMVLGFSADLRPQDGTGDVVFESSENRNSATPEIAPEGENNAVEGSKSDARVYKSGFVIRDTTAPSSIGEPGGLYLTQLPHRF